MKMFVSMKSLSWGKKSAPGWTFLPLWFRSTSVLNYTWGWWRRQWQPTPVLLPGKFHGQRSLVGYSPWGHKESDRTERLHFLSIVPFGERNGNPLQCSCLENPRDGGAWWAAVYGVAQSRTWLKRLSSSSISLKISDVEPHMLLGHLYVFFGEMLI